MFGFREHVPKCTMKVCAAHPTESYDELIVPIEIETQSEQEDIRGARIYYRGTGYSDKMYTEVPVIRKGHTTRVNVKLRALYRMRITDVPQCLIFNLCTASGTSIESGYITTDHSWFKNVLVSNFVAAPYGLDKFNFLLFGVMGSGKTSFFNSIVAMLSPEDSGEALPLAEPTCGGGDHATLKLRCLDIEGMPLRGWDTKGASPDNYERHELEAIMKGVLPPGWDIDRSIDSSMLAEGDVATEAARYSRMPHAAVFMLQHDVFDDTESEFMQKLRGQFQKIVHLGINPIVLVAKLDEAVNEDGDPLTSSIRKDPLAPNADKDSKLKAAARFFGIPEGNVYPCVNYLDASSKSFALDRNLFIILHRILSDAKNRCRSLKLEQETALRMASATELPPILKRAKELEVRLEVVMEQAEIEKADLQAELAGVTAQLAVANERAEHLQSRATHVSDEKDELAAELAVQAESREQWELRATQVSGENDALKQTLERERASQRAIKKRARRAIFAGGALLFACMLFSVYSSVWFGRGGVHAVGGGAHGGGGGYASPMLLEGGGHWHGLEEVDLKEVAEALASCNDSEWGVPTTSTGDAPASPGCTSEMEAAASALVALVNAQPDTGDAPHAERVGFGSRLVTAFKTLLRSIVIICVTACVGAYVSSSSKEKRKFMKFMMDAPPSTDAPASGGMPVPRAQTPAAADATPHQPARPAEDGHPQDDWTHVTVPSPSSLPSSLSSSLSSSSSAAIRD